MVTDEKTIYRNRLIQDVADRLQSGRTRVENEMGADSVAGAVFDALYAINEGIRTQQREAEQRAESAQQRKDIADMRAQEFFVRLRDAGLLKEGERY